MSKYAIIKLLGKQYRVKEGDIIQTDRVDTKVGDKLALTNVLMVSDDQKVILNSTKALNSIVEIKVLDNFKGKKIRVGKFKAKSRYRKVMGHRQHLSNLEIIKISA